MSPCSDAVTGMPRSEPWSSVLDDLGGRVADVAGPPRSEARRPLYNHVDSKESLVDALVELAGTEIERSGPDRPLERTTGAGSFLFVLHHPRWAGS
jgi:hypothetical protein